MALSVETVDGASSAAGTTTLTKSITVTAANRILVGVSAAAPDPVGMFDSLTWNGLDFTAIANSATNGTYNGVNWYQYITPGTGTHDIVLTLNTPGMQRAIHIVSFIDSTAIGAASVNTGTAANASVTVADSANGNIVVALLSTSPGTLTQANTLIFEDENLNGESGHSSQYKTAIGANTAMLWTASPASADTWAASGLAVAGGGGGATALLSRRRR